MGVKKRIKENELREWIKGTIYGPIWHSIKVEIVESNGVQATIKDAKNKLKDSFQKCRESKNEKRKFELDYI